MTKQSRNCLKEAIKAGLLCRAIVALLAMTLIILTFEMPSCFTASTMPPIHKKNQNQVSDFFSKEITDKTEIEQMIQQSKASSQNSIENKASLELLGNQHEINSSATELSHVSQKEAESMGYKVRSENNEFLNSYHVNYNDSQVIEHKRDTDSIAHASSNLAAKLLDKLREYGVADCVEIKGIQEQEPEMYIDIKQLQQKDVIYDKHMCEYLRNRYSCHDVLTMTCKIKGIEWGEWQDKTIHIPGAELVNSGKNVFWADHVASSCFEYKLSVGSRQRRWRTMPPDPYVVNAMREFLAQKHNVGIDNISTEMSSSWYGGIFSISGWTYAGRVLGSKDYAWNTYVVNYKYRDGKPACLEWQERWDERCSLE